MEPRAIKNNEVRTSPLWTKTSPGGACVVLNFNDNALELKNENQAIDNYMRLEICFSHALNSQD